MKIKTRFLCFTLLFAFVSFAQTTKSKIKTLDNFIEKGIELWNPPGLAVTVVKDGEIIFTKGYGTRTHGEHKPVDTHTLFVCASTTKAFVAAGIAMLVDEQKLNWNDPVIQYLPNFQLQDPYMTREITIKDLLTHRTGMGNSDYLWSLMKISSDSILYKMREVEPSYSLRSSFIYQNVMYLAAGKVIEAVTKQSWDSFLKERIYKPLRMNETYALNKMVNGLLNKADAHIEHEDEIIKIEQSVADEIGPAGSMWSSINDMGKWIQFLLNDARVNGDTLISELNFKELFKPQQIIPPNEFYPTQKITKPHWRTYGLGWFQHDYQGKMVQFHTGSLDGMVALAGMIPEENIGVYVMGNLDHVELRHAIMYTTFDLFTNGIIDRDWSVVLKKLYQDRENDEEDPEKIENTTPSLELSKILGKYRHEQYGIIEITESEGGIRFDLNDKIKGSLKHWHYDTYQISFDKQYYGKSMLDFRMNSKGKIQYLEFYGKQYYSITTK